MANVEIISCFTLLLSRTRIFPRPSALAGCHTILRGASTYISPKLFVRLYLRNYLVIYTEWQITLLKKNTMFWYHTSIMRRRDLYKKIKIFFCACIYHLYTMSRLHITYFMNKVIKKEKKNKNICILYKSIAQASIDANKF